MSGPSPPIAERGAPGGGRLVVLLLAEAAGPGEAALQRAAAALPPWCEVETIEGSWPAWDPLLGFSAASARAIWRQLPAALRAAALPEGWVLFLSARERLSQELEASLWDWIARRSDNGASEAGQVTVTSYIAGAYLRRGGWRRAEPRLWRAAALEVVMARAEPESAEVAVESFAAEAMADGLIVDLGPRSLGARLRLINQRSSELRPAAPPTAAAAARAALRELLRRLVLQAGFRDGVAGLVAAALASLERFAALAKAWERAQPAAAPERGDSGR